MKKVMLMLLALILVICLGAVASDEMKSSTKAASPKAVKLHGWVSDEKCGAGNASADKAECAKKCIDGGQKIVFVNDADKKVWKVENPEVFKGHEGHHVKVSAHVYEDKGSIHVMKVSMMKGKS